jgi:hypothetical protein
MNVVVCAALTLGDGDLAFIVDDEGERITPLWGLSTCTYASSNNCIYLRQSKDSRGTSWRSTASAKGVSSLEEKAWTNIRH